MAKSPDAFRTISEVADWLGIQAHVLRFWESKFSQVKPIKRAGGRRYYRPADMLLLGGIKKLLHDDGLTIKGVQKILREEGMGHVADLSQPLDDMTLSQLDDTSAEEKPKEVESAPAEEDSGVVLSFERSEEEETAQEAAPAAGDTVIEETPAAETEEMPEAADPEPAPVDAQEDDAPAEEIAPEPLPETATPEPEPVDAAPEEPAPEDTPPPSTLPGEVTPQPGPAFIHRTIDTPPEDAPAAPPEETPAPAAELPAFLRRSLTEDMPEAAKDASDPASHAPSAPKPRVIDVGPLPPKEATDLAPGTLTAAYRTKALGPARANEIAPLLARLNTLRDAMNARRRSAGNTAPGS